MSNSLNIGGALSGAVDNMLSGSIAGNIQLDGGGSANLKSLSVFANGEYLPPEGYDGFDSVIVDVPSKEEVTGYITENGIHTPPEGKVYNAVEVAVPIPSPVLQSKSISENGTYTPPSGVDGFNEVVVNVPQDTLVTSIAMNNSVYNEGGSTITYNTDSINTVWGGFSNIGCSIVFKIPFRNKSKIMVDIGLYGESYQHAFNNSTRNFNTAIGVTDIVLNSYVNLDNLEANNHLLADVEFNGITNYNLSNIHREVDISDLTNQDLYLFIQIPGVTITNLSISIE